MSTLIIITIALVIKQRGSTPLSVPHGRSDLEFNVIKIVICSCTSAEVETNKIAICIYANS